MYSLPSSRGLGKAERTLSYVYDGAHRRIKETASTAAGTTTTLYLGNYEELTRPDGVVERRDWIGTPVGPAGIVIGRSDPTSAHRYWLTDPLGSVVGVIDEAGVVKQKAAYRTWGDKTQLAQGGPRAEARGYTGHEHVRPTTLRAPAGRRYARAPRTNPVARAK